MKNILDQDDIDDLLSKIYDNKKITQIKPSEIQDQKDIIKRENFQMRFNNVKEIYVKPLEKLLKYRLSQLNQQIYNVDLSDLSIEESIKVLKKQLLNIGFESSQLLSFVPKTVKEVSIIILAKENGFDDSALLSNEDKVNHAIEYLNNLEAKKGLKS